MVKEMIDLEEAKRIFDQYLDDYDRTDDKIHLKQNDRDYTFSLDEW